MTLKLEGVTRIVAGETHIAEINLKLEPGSLNLLLGPTLSGKTSLMRLMAGLDRPSEGRVPLAGARRLDADRHQRAGRPEAGAALMAEHRRSGRGRGHCRYRHGQPGPRAGQGDGAHRA